RESNMRGLTRHLRRRNPSPRLRTARPRFRLHLEELETRTLLSGAGLDNILDAGVVPFASPGTNPTPHGFSPPQIRNAYGLDNIKFGGVTGDGTGQTIAIVDAYNHPNIAGDLAQFSTQFKLPQFNQGAGSPTFTKVNQAGGTSYPRTDAG